MSEFHVEVVRIGPVEKHPNADRLEITKVLGGYPVLFASGQFKEGDLAVYVPVDSVVPAGDPRWEFLGKERRIKAKRLRGVFSMGLLTPLPDGSWKEGDDAQQALNITKYEPPEPPAAGGENERDPSLMPVYDIEGLRRYMDLFIPGEEVWLTEKVDGASSRFVFDGERSWVGSHKTIKKESEHNMWWKIFRKYNLEEKLKTIPKIALYGEVYGLVQKLRYGCTQTDPFRFVGFDLLDTTTRRWLDTDEFLAITRDLDIPVVPTLYRGPWSLDLVKLAEGPSTMPGADHIREGFVAKPIRERNDYKVGRVFLKMPGEGYLALKGRD